MIPHPIKSSVCQSMLSARRFMRTNGIKRQCVRLALSPLITCSHFFGMENRTNRHGSWIQCKLRHIKQLHHQCYSPNRLMKWNANTQFVYANEEQRRHVRLQSSKLWALMWTKRCMCVYLCVYQCEWVCIWEGSVLSGVSALLCSVCCSSAAPSSSLWKLPGPFHERCVIIKWYNAAFCIKGSPC